MTNEQRWAKIKKHERAMAASLCTMHLRGNPMFEIREEKLWLRWKGCDMRTYQYYDCARKVRIVDDTYFDCHRQHPWGGNQGCALVHLAQWIRTGKMPLTYEDWERWCGPPVYLGNKEFLTAIKAVIYGGE